MVTLNSCVLRLLGIDLHCGNPDHKSIAYRLYQAHSATKHWLLRFDAAASVTVQATTNGNNVNNGISEKLTLTIQGVSTFVSAFIVAFVIQWKLTLITISIVPTILIVTGICIGIDTKNEAQLLPIYSKAGLIAEEVFSTVRTVHSFWLNPLLSNRYDKLLGDAMKVGMKKSPNYAVLFSSEFFCVYCGYGLAFWQGIRRYQSGEIDQAGDV